MRAFSLFFVVLPVGLGAGCRGRSDGTVDAGPAVVASSVTTPAKKPPPLRAARPAVPGVPDLPALSAHEPPATAPPDAGLGADPCHAVWTGSQAAPLACARSLLLGSNQGGGAVPVVARKLLSRDMSALPAVVDHRLDGTEGPVRDQGTAPACTAFATASAIDHALARWGGGSPSVSVMQIWSRYHSPEVETSLTSNVGQPLGPESQWPFRATEAMAWVPCSDFAKPPRTGCGKPVDDAHVNRVAASAVGHFTEVEYLGAAPDTPVLQAKLAAGQDVLITIELPSAFVPKGRAGSRYIPDYARSAGPDAGHAMLLAGYAHLPHGTYFLLHNSWGTGWGDGGYAWMHEATLRRFSHEVVAIDAEPVQRQEGSRPLRQRAETTCTPGLVPDSIRSQCTPPCPDHSPRHDGVCPVAGQCPEGFVNLTGACTLAAPEASGKDPQTGVTWTCGPGGCSYVLPRASDPVCSGAVCEASCPAPDFIVARMGNSLVCVE